MKLARFPPAEDASADEAEIAAEAFDRTVAIMLDQVDARFATVSLRAANYLRREICGPRKLVRVRRQ